MSTVMPALSFDDVLADMRVSTLSMLPPRPRAFMAVAVALSVLLHVGGYFWWGEREPALPVAPGLSTATVVTVSLRQVEPEAVAEIPPEPLTAPRPVAPRPVAAEQAPAAKPAPRRVSQPPAPAPAAQASAVTVPPPATPVKAAVTDAPNSQTAVRAAPAVAISAVQQRFLATLLAHIERHKFYPAAARRQGMQAALHIRFQLTADGRITALTIDGGPKLLRHAAEQTLQRAAPLPQPPAGLAQPLPVEFRLAFALQ